MSAGKPTELQTSYVAAFGHYVPIKQEIILYLIVNFHDFITLDKLGTVERYYPNFNVFSFKKIKIKIVFYTPNN